MDCIPKLFDFFRLVVVRGDYGFPYQNISVFSIILCFLSLPTLHQTFIPYYVCLVLIGISSITLTFLFWKFYTQNFNIIWALVHNMIVGLIVVVLLIETNKLFAHEEIEYKNYKITHLKHRTSGRRGNLTLNVIVNINNQDKSFNLSNGDSKKILGRINNWNVKVGLQKGFFGYTLIRSISAFEHNE